MGAGITAVRFESRDSLAMAVGTSVGQVLLYDIRSSRPYLVKEQGAFRWNELAVDVFCKWRECENLVESADCLCVLGVGCWCSGVV